MDVIIDFVPDFSQLQTAFDKLATSGAVDKSVADSFKATTKAVQEQQEEIAELRRTYDQVKNAAKVMGKGVEEAFEQGVADALNEAGVSAKQFNDALNKNGQASIKTTQSLRQELRALTQSIATAKANGGPVDPEMIARAGELKDAIADANAEIANAGSDTRNLDNITGSLRAVAGAFAFAQGAAALFGNENEEVNKALLKVNAAIALSQGATEVLNAVQKEGALTKLADVIAIKGQSAAQTIYTAVTGKATAATRGFKIALATTGVGLLLIGLMALVTALQSMGDEMEHVNKLIEEEDRLIDTLNTNIQRNTDLQVARAESAGKAESELIRIRGRAINAEIAGLEAANARLAQQRDQLSATSEGWFKLNDAIDANLNTIAGLNNQALVLEQGLNKALQDEAKEAADNRQKLYEQSLQNEIDRIKKRLIEVEKGGEEELEIRKQLIVAEGALEIAQAKGNKDRINLIRAQMLAEQDQLSRDFRLKQYADEKAAQERIIAELDKYTAEVNAKLNERLQYEQSLLDARTGVVRRSLQRTVDDEKKTVDQRISALSSLERYQLTAIDQQIETTNKLLIPEEERTLRLAQLADQREQIIEETEAKITEITLAEEEKRKQAREAAWQSALDTARGVADVFGQINQLIGDQESARLSEQRAQLDALIDAGALTDKQAKIREQQLEVAERQAKQRAAVRDKQLALFQAVINGAAAIVEAAPDPFRIATTAALVAAQIALIAARPVPKFARGKKNRYEGPGIVGDQGAELIEQDGRLWVASKPTTVYLGADDKVFTHAETKAIMQNSSVYDGGRSQTSGMSFDYDKMAAAAAKGATQININKDFIEEAVFRGLNKTKYWNKRYSSK